MILNRAYLKYRFKRLFVRQRRDVPIYVFAYHKVGSKFMSRIFRELCWENGWDFASLSGRIGNVPRKHDVIVFNHSLVDLRTMDWPFRGVHLIRDPRDVLVSGYLYHKRCNEEWCLNTDFSVSEPIRYPQISRMKEYMPEAWKARYLRALGNKSYQANLLERSQLDGVLFECEHYAGWTIDAMRAWDYGHPDIMEVRFEDIMANFDSQFAAIFGFLGFSGRQLSSAMRVAAKEDLNRKSAAEISSDPHIASRQTSKWRAYFDQPLEEHFRTRFGNVVEALGYED